jgi:hypothetical protein
MDLTVATVLEEDFNGVMDIASWGSEEFCRNCITYTRGFGCRLRDGSLKMESVKRTTGAGCDPREGWNLYHISPYLPLLDGRSYQPILYILLSTIIIHMSPCA